MRVFACANVGAFMEDFADPEFGELEDTLMQLDELQALVDQLTREEDLPKKK